ncbi:MAG: type IV pilus assembly protein PilM [Candidatus Tectomicrobia bacterium]|nr:type IV pilus assembly protein PilM [Candidatus Tectomicrobia bacterium]
MANIKHKPIIGLDIGSYWLKVAVLKSAGKQFELVNFGVLPFKKKVMSEGVITDRAAVVAGIADLLSSERIKIKEVVTAISGPSVIVKRITVPRMSANEMAETISLEAEQYVPFPINEVNLDFSIVEPEPQAKSSPPKSKAAEGAPEQMEVILVAAKRDRVEMLGEVVREAGLTPKIIDVGLFALSNVFEQSEEQRLAQQKSAKKPKKKKQKKEKKKKGEQEPQAEEAEAETPPAAEAVEGDEEALIPAEQKGSRVVALVNLGYEMVNVNLVKERVPVFTRDIPTGGKKITEAIRERCHVNEDEAESLKLGAPVEGVSKDLVIECIRDSLQNIAEELRRTFEFFQGGAGGQPIERIVLSGGCAAIQGVAQLLSEETELPVELANPFAALKVNPKVFDEEFLQAMAPVAAVSVGLALRSAAEP